MSYKPSLIEFYRKRNGALLEGKDTILLAKQDNKFYRVKELVGLVMDIKAPCGIGPNIPTVTLRFGGGQEYKVRAYLDTNITKNSFVSIYAIVTKNQNGELEITCKGGMVRLFGALTEGGRVNTKYIYRFGFGDLSRIEASPRYSSNLDGIEVLEENLLWTYSADNIQKLEEQGEESFVEEDSTIDFSQGSSVYIAPINQVCEDLYK